MKAVKYVTDVMHYVFFCAAFLSVLALVSLTGSTVRNIVTVESAAAYARLIMLFGAAFAGSVVLFLADSWAGRFVSRRN